jgi:hypothetical protein
LALENRLVDNIVCRQLHAVQDPPSTIKICRPPSTVVAEVEEDVVEDVEVDDVIEWVCINSGALVDSMYAARADGAAVVLVCIKNLKTLPWPNSDLTSIRPPRSSVISENQLHPPCTYFDR